MREDTVVQLCQPGTFSEDALTEILRFGARRLLAQAVEMGHCHINRSISQLDQLGAKVRSRHWRFAKPRTMWFEALCTWVV